MIIQETISIGIEESGDGVELAVWIDQAGGAGGDGWLEMVPVEQVPTDIVLDVEV